MTFLSSSDHHHASSGIVLSEESDPGFSFPDSMPAPPGVADTAYLGIGGTLHAIGFILLAFAIWNRSYAPIRAKQLDVIAAGTFSGFCWWLGSAHSVGIIAPSESGAFAVCQVWDNWIQLALGLFLFAGLLNYRMWRLFVIFRSDIFRLKSNSLSTRMLGFLILLFPSTLVGIVSSTYYEGGFFFLDDRDECFCETRHKIFYYVVVVIIFFINLTFVYLLRNIKKGFNEYQEARICLLIAAIAYIIKSVIVFRRDYYQPWARIFGESGILIASLAFSYTNLIVPLYGCYFDNQGSLDRFRDSLKMEMDYDSSNNSKRRSLFGSSANSNSQLISTDSDNNRRSRFFNRASAMFNFKSNRSSLLFLNSPGHSAHDAGNSRNSNLNINIELVKSSVNRIKDMESGNLSGALTPDSMDSAPASPMPLLKSNSNSTKDLLNTSSSDLPLDDTASVTTKDDSEVTSLDDQSQTNNSMATAPTVTAAASDPNNESSGTEAEKQSEQSD